MKDDAPEDDRESADKERRQQLAEIIRQHNDSLVWFLEARLNSHEDAQEVAQEAYVRFLGLRDCRVISYHRAYLYQIAANLAKSRLRERAVRQRRAPELQFFENSGRNAPTPEGVWIAQEEQELLERAVQRLPAKTRMAFTMVELEDKPYDAVAAHMGEKINTVRQMVHRAYGYLAKAISDQAPQAVTPKRGRS